jgi:PKD repeat protein
MKQENKTVVNSNQTGTETATKMIMPSIEAGKSDAEVLDILKALYANIPDVSWDDIKSDVLILTQNTRISFEQKLKDKRQEEIQASKQGRGSNKIPTAEIITLAEAEKRFVYLNVGQQVFDLDHLQFTPAQSAEVSDCSKQSNESG